MDEGASEAAEVHYANWRGVAAAWPLAARAQQTEPMQAESDTDRQWREEMSQATQAARMEQAIRAYIHACNEGDATAIAACFTPDAVHYSAMPKWTGAKLIGGNFSKRVSETGQWWTVDQILIDASRLGAILEWTRFDPSQQKILRGVDWFVFDQTFRFREARTYLAGRNDPAAQRQELQDFDYAGRGYPTTFDRP